jgi:hypothetical protein
MEIHLRLPTAAAASVDQMSILDALDCRLALVWIVNGVYICPIYQDLTKNAATSSADSV